MSGGCDVGVGALVRAELERHDWGALACLCGDSADHVPLLFEGLLTAETPREMLTLDGHVEDGCVLAECTAPAVGVIMAALAGEVSVMARDQLLRTLVHVAAGSGCDEGLGRWPLGDACRAGAEEGFWTLVRIGLTGSGDDAETVADICAFFALGGDKAAHYQTLLRERARARTKRGARR
ncbi:hypothetical protein AB0E83_03675 [Streptomyces sp. NPDC035033]|uniref:hypothetical protein n=1 Tax=Streptomyces sp. NPDC035033 TaxID=3155368 RepID=UPI0033D063C1